MGSDWSGHSPDRLRRAIYSSLVEFPLVCLGINNYMETNVNKECCELCNLNHANGGNHWGCANMFCQCHQNKPELWEEQFKFVGRMDRPLVIERMAKLLEEVREEGKAFTTPVDWHGENGAFAKGRQAAYQEVREMIEGMEDKTGPKDSGETRIEAALYAHSRGFNRALSDLAAAVAKLATNDKTV